MKTIRTSICIFFASFLCNSCCNEDVCKTIDKADLIVDAITAVLVEADPTYSRYGVVSHTLNTIADITCSDRECEGAETAQSHHYQSNIYYSQTGDDNWGSPVSDTSYAVDPLAACSSHQIDEVLRFLVDGYYLIEGIIDIFNEVDERNESNNGSFGNPGKKSSDNTNQLIIHVNNGLKAEVFKADGTPLYVIRESKN